MTERDYTYYFEQFKLSRMNNSWEHTDVDKGRTALTQMKYGTKSTHILDSEKVLKELLDKYNIPGACF